MPTAERTSAQTAGHQPANVSASNNGLATNPPPSGVETVDQNPTNSLQLPRIPGVEITDVKPTENGIEAAVSLAGGLATGTIDGSFDSLSSFDLSGDLNFDNQIKLIDKANINASYKKEEGGEAAFSVSGTLETAQIPGLEEAELTLGYDTSEEDPGYKITASGAVKPKIPGVTVSESTLDLEYSEGSLTLQGAVTLESIKFINSIEVAFEVGEEDGTYKLLSITGAASLDFYGFQGTVEIEYEDEDIFTFTATVSTDSDNESNDSTGPPSSSRGTTPRSSQSNRNEGGRRKGNVRYNGGASKNFIKSGEVSIIITNKDKDDNASDRLFGSASVTVNILDWVEGTAKVELLDNGIEVSASLGTTDEATIADQKSFGKKIEPPALSIPIFGVSALGTTIGISANLGVIFTAGFSWGPLKLTKLEISLEGYNPSDTSNTKVTGTLGFSMEAGGSLSASLKASLAAGIAILTGELSLSATGKAAVNGKLTTDASIEWQQPKGLGFKAEPSLELSPTFTLSLDAGISLGAKLIFIKLTVFEKTWNIAAFTFEPSEPLKMSAVVVWNQTDSFKIEKMEPPDLGAFFDSFIQAFKKQPDKSGESLKDTIEEPDLKEEDMVDVGRIESLGRPQRGQSHRSSRNMPFKLSSGAKWLKWNIELQGGGNVKQLRFDVKKDRSFASDPTLLSNVSPDQITSVDTPSGDFESGGKYYIADPKNAATGNDFGVPFIVKVKGA